MKRADISNEENENLKDALLDYLYAVDSLSDIEFMMECFTPDAVLDLSGLNLGEFRGAKEIRGFFEKVFETMSHHMHTMTNFRVKHFAGNQAACHAYVCGMGRSKAGVDVHVYVYYDINMRRTERGWKIERFYEAPQLPMPASVGEAFSQ